MRKLSAIFLVISALTAMTGCGGGYKEGVKVEEQKAYLYFTGDTAGAEVTIDGVPFILGENVTKDDLFQITPGQRQIEVKQHGKTVINRELFISDGISREIQIP